MAERIPYTIPKPEPRKDGILAVQLWVPPELRDIIGRKKIRRTTGTRDPKLYEKKAGAIVADIEAMFREARDKLTPPGRWVTVRPPIRSHIAYRPITITRGGTGHRYVFVPDGAPDAVWEEIEALQPARPTIPTPLSAPMVDVTTVRSVVRLDQAIADWKKKHGAWPDTDAGSRAEVKAEQAKRRAAKSLFTSAGTDNMAAIDTATIQKWADGLHGRVAYDYVTAVKTLYRRLKKSNRFPKGMEDPAAEIEAPPKPQHQARDQFAGARAADILASAAASNDPLVRWGHPIMAYTGAIISEFIYAPTSEFKRMRGIWVWHVGEKRALKTNNRPRVIPLHPALVAAGFLDYVKSREGRLLFDTDNTKASAALMAHLRGLGIEGDDQVNYSWRHGFISRLVNHGVDPTLRRYLDGHGLGHIDEKHYIHHHMTKMVEAIRSIEPTAPYAQT